jgi:hypothetical protein
MEQPELMQAKAIARHDKKMRARLERLVEVVGLPLRRQRLNKTAFMAFVLG